MERVGKSGHCCCFPRNTSACLHGERPMTKTLAPTRHILSSTKSKKRKAGVGLVSALLLSLAAGTANAQQATGAPGSPGATTTIPGNQLPPPDPKFGGVIRETAKDSKPYWPPAVVPPKGAPNILLIMTDDQGYGIC